MKTMLLSKTLPVYHESWLLSVCVSFLSEKKETYILNLKSLPVGIACACTEFQPSITS